MRDHKKLFVVSDVHGHCTLLKEALERAGFDKDDPRHLLVCCGDYFDRGNENVEVLKFFERIKHKVLLRGNHEDMLDLLFQDGRILPHHRKNGTMITLENFFGKYFFNPLDDTIDFSGKTRTVDRICEFIDETINYYETENFVFVHGWLPENGKTKEGRINVSDLNWTEARKMRWTDEYTGRRPLEDKTLVCGHMPCFYANEVDKNRSKNDADIFYGNGFIAIDGGTFDSKQVNVLVLEENISEADLYE